ncbi:raptor N-terminal caspase like domain-containing protein [Fomes fomentarius]|nr:raptor N-terminal caspase like domain-containing protein [Fomes fomentarius]
MARRSDDSDPERDHHSSTHSDPSSSRMGTRDMNGLSNPDLRHGESVTDVPEAAPIHSYWATKCHLTCGNTTPPLPGTPEEVSWRAAPGKIKTAHAALVLCLNIDVDPPDIVKTNLCAVLEAWVDPHTMPSHKALEVIGQNLQHQFEGLNPKILYKPLLDPSKDDLKRFCANLRKSAMDDAVLFHYIGHGIPKPTPSGELWCFNRNYTQYIPVALKEIQSWLRSPCIFIWDCSTAGNLLVNFVKVAKQHDNDAKLHGGGYPEGMPPILECIQLAACVADEQLPSCPELPADLFTSCLTSPIDIALRYFLLTNQLPNDISTDHVMQLPGDLKDRRTPLGELNWIFTAIMDTIAWTMFPRKVFTRLYRSDLLIASLFHNFLLAERIMKNYHCTPHTYPPLPLTNTHPLWVSWDLAVDACLHQLSDMLKNTEPSIANDVSFGARNRREAARNDAAAQPNPLSKPNETPYLYIPSRFFTDQLTAFEVWISRGGSALTKPGPLSLPVQIPPDQSHNLDGPSSVSSYASSSLEQSENHLVPRKPPDQLPIVLQVLLSQPHRLRALILLSQFIDLGLWAVHLALTIGIFPYITRLLQAAGQDLKPVLIFIWAQISAIDPSCQVDLYNNQGYKYFASTLAGQDAPRQGVFLNGSEHKAMCAFILSIIARDYAHGQNACWREHVFDSCFDHLDEGDFLLQQWSALCIAQIWDVNDEIKVRSAALYALSTFLDASGSSDLNKLGGGGTGMMYQLDECAHFWREVVIVTGATLAIKEDASLMVQKELLVLISCLVKEWRGHFIVCAWIYWEEARRWKDRENRHPDDDLAPMAIAEWLESYGDDDDDYRAENRVLLLSFFTIFSILLELSVDPYHEVAMNAQTIVDYIMALLLELPFTRLDSTTLNRLPDQASSACQQAPSDQSSLLSGSGQVMPGGSRPPMTRSETMMSTISSGVTSTLRQTSSFANALKNLAGNIAFPTIDDGQSSSSPKPQPTGQEQTEIYTSPYWPESGDTHSSGDSQQSPMEFMPSDVMEALMEEDMERLKARRHIGNHSHHPPPPQGWRSLGTGVGIRDVLPLKSWFYDWCCEYFKEPQMRQPEVDEPGSMQYNHQVWRQQWNEQVCEAMEKHAREAPRCWWEKPVNTIQINGLPLSLAFHTFDPHLVIANESDMITVWDWIKRKRLNRFFNGNPRGTSITSLHIINQDAGGIILTGAADGMIRLYRNYDPSLCSGPVQMVSAFRGLNKVLQVYRGSGVITDWKQAGGTLMVGGDSRIVHVWDAHTESQLMDIDTDAESPITTLVSDSGSSSVFLASFADGVVKVFDRRLEEEDAVVREYHQHSSWVQNVKWHPTLASQLLSGSLDGEVKLWDIRGGDAPLHAWDLFPQGLSSFDVHEQTTVFAATSSLNPSNWRSQRTKVCLLDSTRAIGSLAASLSSPPLCENLTLFTPKTGSLTFHPWEMVYGVGFWDGTVRIMGCKLPLIS